MNCVLQLNLPCLAYTARAVKEDTIRENKEVDRKKQQENNIRDMCWGSH